MQNCAFMLFAFGSSKNSIAVFKQNKQVTNSNDPDLRSVFLSDSLSCLQSLKNRDLLIADILCRVHILLSHGTKVAFMWVPSHVELADNPAADIAAKQPYSHQYQIHLFLLRTSVLSYVPTH
jgi:ribonuclease HI